MKKEDAEIKDKNILIDNGLLIYENMNMNKIPKISNELNSQYGLDLIFFNMISGMSITNELICNSNILFSKIKNNDEEVKIFNTYSFTKLQKLNEYIVYDLKKYADEIISVMWLLKQDKYVEDIAINSIGKYLSNNKSKDYNYDEYNEYLKFFQKLNDIENAYKHSYTNDAVLYNIGVEKNYIVVYYSKHGKKIKNPSTISIELDSLINMFNDFYNYSFKLIESLSNK